MTRPGHVASAPRLTVLLVTFNHERYVGQACDSIIGQRLNEPFQVVVADDSSTDATRRIIAESFARPGAPPIRFLDHAEKRGITPNYLRAFAACDTDYVAILEGDDFWIHPQKLARQLGFLDEHWECAAVSANYFVYDERISQYTARTQADGGHSYLDARALIRSNIIGNFSTSEIAHMLDLHEAAVRQRLVRARKQFQQLYALESGERISDSETSAAPTSTSPGTLSRQTGKHEHPEECVEDRAAHDELHRSLFDAHPSILRRNYAEGLP